MRQSLRRTAASSTRPIVHASSPAYRLQCPLDCPCRCHSPFSQQVVPQRFIPFLGQLILPKRILHTLGVSAWECNVQTCRRDHKEATRVSWIAPWWLPVLDIHVGGIRLPFRFSIHATRVVPGDAKVWQMIDYDDPDGLRALFEASEASIHDVDDCGTTLLEVSSASRLIQIIANGRASAPSIIGVRCAHRKQ